MDTAISIGEEVGFNKSYVIGRNVLDQPGHSLKIVHVVHHVRPVRGTPQELDRHRKE